MTLLLLLSVCGGAMHACMVATLFVQKFGEAFVEGQMQVAEFVRSFKQQQKVRLSASFLLCCDV